MQKVDEKGKYFTERVHTHSIEVLVRTLHGHIRGHIHIMPGRRLKDTLNDNEQFIALTDATITRDDVSTEEVRFIALNKQHIVSVIPLEEDKVVPPADEYIPY